MSQFGLAAQIAMVLVSFPAAAWLGAVLTRPGRKMAATVERHFRALVIGLILLKLAGSLVSGTSLKSAGLVIELAAIYLLAMLFVPMLRRLQARNER